MAQIIPSKVFLLLENALDTLTEVGNGATDEELWERRKELFEVREILREVEKSSAEQRAIRTDDEAPEWMQEFLFDPEASEKIVDVIYKYPFCLRDAADLVIATIPLVELMSGHGMVDKIRELVSAYLQDRRRWIRLP